MLPLFHVHVYVLGGQWCLCSCPCVRMVNVSSIHVNVYVLGGGGRTLLPLFMSMYMC